VGFLPDDRIANYRVERELGTTATGVLYQAVHLVLPRRAVLKVMPVARSQGLAIQLLREACMLEALQHPGIPQVYESGLLDDGRRPWFAFEMIEGMTLSERMVNGPLTAIEVATIARDLAAILEHAHKRGIVHRALRPDHVVISSRRRGASMIAIPDWSDARAHDATTEHAPLVSSRAARPYLAPELVRGEPADDRADVFALGVMAYQALTGFLPRGDATIDRSPEAPKELAALIDQMLAPDRFDRPTTAEIRSDLEWLAEALAVELQLDESDDIAPSSSTTLRIRRPRWTPPIPNSPNAQQLAQVSGEIVIKPPPKPD
jgi:eukaryotic-like serine/threonine-protein kinase